MLKMRVRTVDIRQVMAAFLTLSMFGMLANMIKRDHFDYVEVKYPRGSTVQYHTIKITGKRSAIKFPEAEKELPMKEKRQLLKPCWKISSPKERQQCRGYVTFSLTNGPEYHVSQEGSLRIWTYSPLISMRKNKGPKALDWTACLAMFEALQLQPHVRGIVDGMLRRLSNSEEGSKRSVIAVDLRDEVLHSKSCGQLGDDEIKLCDANEVGNFLRKTGFGPKTAIYLPRSRWHASLDSMRDLFPRTYTKELMNPQDQRDSVLGKVIDFVVCSENDVYVPIIEDQFSTNVAGARIASGRTEILVPTKISGFSGSQSHYIAPYISKKTHFAYSCLI